MNRNDLAFDRPSELAAARPPEDRGSGRDDVRLLVTTPSGHRHSMFRNLPDLLEPGDLLVINNSGTLPASLPARGKAGEFALHLSTRYGPDVWLTEPRWGPESPGPLPVEVGERIEVAGVPARVVAPYPGISDLWFMRFHGDVGRAMASYGRPIHYGHVEAPYPLKAYQTIFAGPRGSAEMPSASRPFTPALVWALKDRGVDIQRLTLHAGVSSLEVDAQLVENHPLFPEPFRLPESAAAAVNNALQEGRRVIAVGTTVVRALESAWAGDHVRPMEGFTRIFIRPGRKVNVVSGLLTGFHDPHTSHLAMLYALAGQEVIRDAYQEAIRNGYLWHEFGDSHLILTEGVLGEQPPRTVS